VTVVPLPVADTTLFPVAVELRVPVATPLVVVVPEGWVRELPDPVADRTTVTPWIRLPKPSLAVTVIVEAFAPLLASISAGEAVTVDWDAENEPAFTVTLGCCVRTTPFTVAVTLLSPATVELRVPATTPFASVVVAGWVTVFPDPLADNTTVAPAIALPKASLAVTVIVELEAPVLAVIVVGTALAIDWAAETPAAVIVKGSETLPERPVAVVLRV